MSIRHPFRFPLHFLFASFFLIVLASCGGSNKKETETIAVTDTTELGKKIAAVSKRIGENGNDANLWHERAQLHMLRSDVNNAMSDVVKAIDIDSTKSTYFLTLSDIYFAQGQIGKSKASLEKCLSLDPKNTTALEKIAELYFYAKQYEPCMTYLDQVLKIDINHPKTYFMKGMVYKEKGDTAKAISSFQTAIEQRSDYYDAYVQNGILYTPLKTIPWPCSILMEHCACNPRVKSHSTAEVCSIRKSNTITTKPSRIILPSFRSILQMPMRISL